MLAFQEFTAVTTVGDLLMHTAAALPDKDGMVFPDGRQSFAEVRDGAIRMARGFLAMGVQPGDHVGMLLPSSRETVEAFFGLALIGAISVPINARFRSRELTYITENADLVAILTSGKVSEGLNFIDRLTESFPDLAKAPQNAELSLAAAPRLKRVILVSDDHAPGFTDAATFGKSADTILDETILSLRAHVRVSDTALILYTSGTTSDPKGCLISHEALVRTGQAMAKRYDMTEADVFWSPLPMYHIGAMFPLCAAWSVGATYLSMQYFDAGVALEMIERDRATVTYPSFGTFIADMIYHPDFEKRDLSSIRIMNSNMAMQPPSFARAIQDKIPNIIQVGTYGMTETSGTVTTSFPTDSFEARTGRLGKPFDGLKVRITRPDGTECGTDEIGEICVRGFSIFTEYYKDPVKTAEAKKDGWFHTGDLGSMDTDGTLMFHGRLKDMLKVGGENVAAQEIETLVCGHDAVKLCQVVGRPDARLQEVPVAFVELKPGKSATPDEIIGFCKGKIASFKVPRDVRFISEWPMSSSKIQKFKLKEMLEA
ncbi:class I adenylate-forming enzyme family protein [Maritimibacter sp. DP1N21-5]|uniref:class I adenylate-forming enzyme family protein n=1 Tax=Maritimibacter sp. DP1N21-5 TaxID=2836867 RepID=UPI001C4640C0|nr:class I adenylate-forming enzyme family protein [Maritimibacter sp. DP1N21-5]MBV7407453.1 acyl--CoA ligase [Maritimibacter sp. DP1N21-5]